QGGAGGPAGCAAPPRFLLTRRAAFIPRSVRLRGAGDRLPAGGGADQPVTPGLQRPRDFARLAVGPAHRHRGDRLPVAEAEAGQQDVVRLVSAAGLDLAHLPPAVLRADVDARADGELVGG